MTWELLDYAANGGSLLLTGGNTCRFFAQAGLPVSFVPVNGHVCRFTDGDDAGTLENALGISAKNTEVISLSGDSYRSADVPSSVVLSFGKGKIALVGADIGSQYGACGQYFHRILMNRICDTLYAPMVRVDKVTGLLEVTVLRKDCKMFIQLVNANGNHKSTTVATEDFIPPVLDAEFSISLDRQPAALIQQPSGKELSFIYENGIAHTTISRVDIHEIIEIMNA